MHNLTTKHKIKLSITVKMSDRLLCRPPLRATISLEREREREREEEKRERERKRE